MTSVLSCMLPLCSFAMEKEAPHPLVETTQQYVNFINRLNKGEDFAQHDVAATLLAPDCKKIFNGTVFSQSRQAFVDDLVALQRTLGSWHLRPADIILSQEKNVVVVRLFVDMEKGGHYTEIVIFRFNSEGLIQELNIVFNKIEEGYHFEGEQE